VSPNRWNFYLPVGLGAPRPEWKPKRLIRLGFVPGSNETAFDFVGPAQVVRSAHLIPNTGICLGSCHQIHAATVIARGIKEPDDDWQLYICSNVGIAAIILPLLTSTNTCL